MLIFTISKKSSNFVVVIQQLKFKWVNKNFHNNNNNHGRQKTDRERECQLFQQQNKKKRGALIKLGFRV